MFTCQISIKTESCINNSNNNFIVLSYSRIHNDREEYEFSIAVNNHFVNMVSIYTREKNKICSYITSIKDELTLFLNNLNLDKSYYRCNFLIENSSDHIECCIMEDTVSFIKPKQIAKVTFCFSERYSLIQTILTTENIEQFRTDIQRLVNGLELFLNNITKELQ